MSERVAPARAPERPHAGAPTRRHSGRPRPLVLASVLLASVAATLALVAAAEVALRVLRPLEPPTPVAFTKFHPTETRRGLLVDDPHTAYALAPDYRASARHAGAYATGTWPYRNAPPRAGLARVVVLGDSCVYGVGVHASETLPAAIADALARRGRAADTLEVLNLGVPGFSSAQTRAQLEELLRHDAPACAVFYLAAWNDQAPALVQPDADILAARRGFAAWVRTTALHRLLVSPSAGATGPADLAAVRAAWEERGERPHGARVAPEELSANVAALLSACRSAGVEALLVLPAWPAATEERFERLASDRERVRAAAQAAGVPCLDARQALDQAGLTDRAAFLDLVHPSPAAHAVLGESVAAALAQRLPAAAAPAAGLTIRSLEPASACALGDARIQVTLEGLGAGQEPLVIVGHAPLFDLHSLGDGRFAGTLPANGPGLHDVVVQAGTRCALRADALELWEPRIELDAAHTELVLRARPGDAALVVAATRLAPEPALDARGAAGLDPAHVLASFPGLVAGADGLAHLPIDLQAVDPSGGLWLQALITPAGTEDKSAQRYGALLDLRAAWSAQPAAR